MVSGEKGELIRNIMILLAALNFKNNEHLHSNLTCLTLCHVSVQLIGIIV